MMHLVNSKMIEIKEFRIMMEQNIQRRLLADEAQVKSEEFNNLMRFRQYVKDRVSQLHAQMSVGWDT